jgi:RNA polymerase sigma-70 factor (ECF subfamily)
MDALARKARLNPAASRHANRWFDRGCNQSVRRAERRDVQPRPRLVFQRSIGAEAPRGASMNAATDQWGELMAAAQRGHAAAYRRLLDELRHWLKGFYARRLPPAMVEDAVQDTLIAIHEKRHTYDPTRPFKPWLIAVARYKWIDRLRSMSRSRTEELPDEIAVADHESSVTSSVVLTRLMTELKPAQAEAIRLVKIEGFSVEEAADRTGQSGSLIKVNIHRGLARLAAIVQKQTDAE